MASEYFIPKILVNDGWGYSVSMLRDRTKLEYIIQSEKGNEIVHGLLFFPGRFYLLEKGDLMKQFREVYSLSNEISCVCIWIDDGDAAQAAHVEEDLELKKLGCPYTILTTSIFLPDTFKTLSSWFQKHIKESCSIKPAKR